MTLMPLDPDLKALATGKNFAALTTLRSDGSPSTHVMWVHATDDRVTINTEIHRAKYKHVQRDPRVAVTVWDSANPYRYVEVIGRVDGEIRGPEARSDIDELSVKYTGGPYANPITSERVILTIVPDHLHKNGE
jgi:PPOX class probable F420-dependent enzyme